MTSGHRAVAQFGSALDWGSRGRRFKSCQPDRRNRSSEAVPDDVSHLANGLFAWARPYVRPYDLPLLDLVTPSVWR